MAALPQWELTMKVTQLLGLRGPWCCQICRDTDCLVSRSYDPIRVLFQASCSWRSDGLFGQSFSIAPPVQALTGLPCLGPFSVFHLKGPPWIRSYSVVQCLRHLTRQALYCSAADSGSGAREAMVVAPPLHVTQQYRLASMAAWFSSTSIPHHSLLPHTPQSISLQSSAALTLGVLHNAQTPAPSPCGFQRTCVPVQDMHGCSKVCLSLFPFRLPQTSCFISALNVSPLTDSCPKVGIGPLLQICHQLRAGPVLPTLLFFPLVPSSYRVLRGSIYSLRWSGAPVCSQLVFCMHFCVWRCLPDASVETDVLHIHLLLCHLVLLMLYLYKMPSVCLAHGRPSRYDSLGALCASLTYVAGK